MPPTDRFVISFAAEPPQEALPYGRWAETLRSYFLAAAGEIDSDGEDVGEPGQIAWFPDRTYGGRTYVPAVARTSTGFELFGFVSFSEGSGGPSEFEARVDFTAEVAEQNPDWKLDLNDDVVATWRGEQGKAADMTLVWGTPLMPGGAMVTGELANVAVDQCELIEERFTLLAPDNYRSDYLEVKLWDRRGQELAAESLYVDDDDADEASPEPDGGGADDNGEDAAAG
jgi:hypothetical protein